MEIYIIIFSLATLILLAIAWGLHCAGFTTIAYIAVFIAMITLCIFVILFIPYSVERFMLIRGKDI